MYILRKIYDKAMTHNTFPSIFQIVFIINQTARDK